MAKTHVSSKYQQPRDDILGFVISLFLQSKYDSTTSAVVYSESYGEALHHAEFQNRERSDNRGFTPFHYLLGNKVACIPRPAVARRDPAGDVAENPL